jgi:hypothetical protein
MSVPPQRYSKLTKIQLYKVEGRGGRGERKKKSGETRFDVWDGGEGPKSRDKVRHVKPA